MKTENISDPSWKHIQERDKRITELEAEIEDIRSLYGVCASGANDLMKEIARMRPVVEASEHQMNEHATHNAGYSPCSCFVCQAVSTYYEATKPCAH